jgi:competence protein ComEA
MKRRGFLALTLSVLAAPAVAQTRPPPAPAQLDLNSASRDDLMTLDGIGEVRAEAIIRARPFRAKTELVERRLIPEALYEKIADKVMVRASPPPPRPPTSTPGPPPAQPRRG